MTRTRNILIGLMMAGTAGPVSAQTAGDPAVPNYAIPPGFVRVWTDDRLNARRGIGTAQGEAQMNAIWTEDTPRTLRPYTSGVTTVSVPVGSARGDVLQTVPGVFVQVATFADPASAALAADQLAVSGIPTRRGVLRRGSAEQPLVLAGPYPSLSAATAGLADVQRKGYPGAFIRN